MKLARMIAVFATLALAVAGASAAATAESLTAQSGQVSATLTWTKKNYEAEHVHLTIVRAGVTMVDADLLGDDGKPTSDTPEALTVTDLDGSGEPEVIADLYTNGAHCCSYSRIYRYPDLTGSGYETVVQQWGNAGYLLRDLDGDGLPEFRSDDDRFAYEFSCYACSGEPIQIWQFRGGDFAPEMQDVTRSFPELVKKDAARWWKVYLHERGHKFADVRGLIAAWAADEYLLDHQAKVSDTLQKLLARGDLTVKDGGVWPSGKKYVRHLKQFLRNHGYDKLPA